MNIVPTEIFTCDDLATVLANGGTEIDYQACMAFSSGFNMMISVIGVIFVALLPIILAIKITSFAGEDG
jgi:hypothetical protein